MTPERINKFLASRGFGSRRSVESLIREGRVLVNQKIAILGQSVTDSDTVTIDNVPVNTTKQQTIILALYKPKGVTTTKSDPHAKVTVMDYIPMKYKHLFPIGRLDKQSEGLILLTNNGDLAQKLQHPKYEHEKEYDIVAQALTQKNQVEVQHDMQRVQTSIINTHVQTQPIAVAKNEFNPTTHTLKATVILKEGKKRQIREVFKSLGWRVMFLKRTRIGKLKIGSLRIGEYREIRENEL